MRPRPDMAPTDRGSHVVLRYCMQEDVEDEPETKGRTKWFRRVGNRLRVLRRRKKHPELDEPNPSSGLRIMIVSDAWHPQVNGVVRTLETLGDQLQKLGNEVQYVTPDMFRTIPLPTYPEIRLAIWPNRLLAKLLNEFRPHAIHIATEGPLGLAARRFCMRRDHPFTTSLHTRFPEYIHARIGFPIKWGYWLLRMFHKPASAVMVATQSLKRELEARDFKNIRLWSRGVDTKLFRIHEDIPEELKHFKRPLWLYVGRIAVEKNVEAFLSLDLEGTKVLVGDGPSTAYLQGNYEDARFLGPRFKEELARIYSACDVFVFPSRTDTFGLVNIEALACGTPVAAYPVQGPLDILEGAHVGMLSEDLGEACRQALGCATPEECRAYAMKFSWENCTRQFLVNLDLPGFDESYWEESAKLPD